MSAELTHLPSFGRYEPVFRIASGGMAEVYGARAVGEAGFRRWVALKRMLPHLGDDPVFLKMFLDEGRIAANIVHPNVVSTLDLGRSDDGSAYLVMDLVIGSTLSAMFRSAGRRGARIPMAVALEVLAQAAAGLHAAHEATTPEGEPLRIVHRDVSPQNILVGANGRAQIMDFGVARAAMRESRTRTGEVKGKLAYFSPEQASADEIDRRSDVFSLATVGWEILAGRRLFHAENPLNILRKLTQAPILRLDEIDPSIPAAIADVIARGLERSLDARTASCADFAEGLRDAIRETQLFCSEADVGRAARELGSPTIERIESAIRQASDLEAERGEPAVAPPLEVSEVSQTRKTLGRPGALDEPPSASGGEPEDFEPTAPTEPTQELETAAATLPSQPAHEMLSRSWSVPRGARLGTLVVVLGLGALVAALLGGRPEERATETPAASATASDSPERTVDLAPTVTTTNPSDLQLGVGAEGARVGATAVPSTAAHAADLVASDAGVLTEAPSPAEPNAAGAARGARRARGSRRGGGTAARVRASASDSPTSLAETTDPARPTEPEASHMRSTPMRGLRGVEAFERDLGASSSGD